MLSVDAYRRCVTAYAAWDLEPGDPDLANKVVAAINAVVDAQVRSQPNGAGLKYLVIVGGDRVIPQGRLGDFTSLANENGYADTFDRRATSTPRCTPGRCFPTTLRHPRAGAVPQPAAPYPATAVGPARRDAGGDRRHLTRFTTSTGASIPRHRSITGYDFMQDGAAAINYSFASRFGAGTPRR